MKPGTFGLFPASSKTGLSGYQRTWHWRRSTTASLREARCLRPTARRVANTSVGVQLAQQTALFSCSFDVAVCQQKLCSHHAWRQFRTAAARNLQILHRGVTTTLYLLDLRGQLLQSDLCLLRKSIRAVVAPLIDHAAVIYRCDGHCCQCCLTCLSKCYFEAVQNPGLCDNVNALRCWIPAVIEEVHTTATTTRGMRVRL